MKFFNRKELGGIIIIFAFLVLISTPNFLLSLRRARDAQRRSDVGSIYDALNKYQVDFGTFPLSVDGKIAACAPVTIKEAKPQNMIIFSPCAWGKDSLADLSDTSYPPYLKPIPNDSQAAQGASYLYLSDGSTYQVYGAFEGMSEPEYDPAIVKRNLKCGNRVCNFGKAYARTPLDKSIEEYENEKREKK